MRADVFDFDFAYSVIGTERPRITDFDFAYSVNGPDLTVIDFEFDYATEGAEQNIFFFNGTDLQPASQRVWAGSAFFPPL
jgi:hypothetical protein